MSNSNADMVGTPDNPDVSSLWNDEDTERFNNETYHHLLMEQYKLYVNIADNINSRRTIINTFFLTVHVIIIGIIGLSLSRQPTVPNLFLLLITLVGLLILCFAWWRLAKYYRQHARAKKAVIAELEGKLPSNPCMVSDRHFVSHKKNPLNSIESVFPIVFGFLYILSYAYVAYLSSH
jgi:hypothetical protein